MPSHNCINNFNVQFSRCIFETLQETQWNIFHQGVSVNLFLEVVGQNGLEPSTSRLSVVCSSQLSYWPISRRNQIHNFRFEIINFKSPLCLCFSSPNQTRFAGLWFGSMSLKVVGQNGLEPSTSRLSVVCSSQLSYWPISASTILGTSFPVPSKLNNTKSV